MSIVNRGFHGRREPAAVALPPGQHLTNDFPVLQSGPTPHVDLDDWRFTIRNEVGMEYVWTWPQMLNLPAERPVVDIHCVTSWSKLATRWAGVSLDVLFASVETTADFALVGSYGGYTTNLPLDDLLGGKAWIAHTYEDEPLTGSHGGPARLLVPHLYLWKSAKWVRSIQLRDDDQPGFWEQLGYHEYGDPWREQRYADD